MGKYGFEHGTYFMLNHTEYIVRKSDIRDVVIENIPYKKIETWSRKELTSLWEKGELVFRIKNSDNSDQGERRIQGDFDMLPDEYKKEALRRYEILKPVIKREISSKGIVDYLESLPEHLRVSRATFYSWKKIWEAYEDLRYLVPQYEARGPKKSYTDPIVIKIMDEVINDYVYRGEKYTDRVMYLEFLLRVDEYNEFRENDEKLKLVSKSTFIRRRKLITDQHKKNKLKYGKPKADLMKNGSTTEVYATRPLERVEIDWTPIDVLLVDPETLKAKKPFLIYAIDKFSGYPLGFFVSFSEPDVIALKQCLLHCLMPKTYVKEYYPLVQNEWIAYGKPEYIVLDNAQVNNSRDLEDVCRELDIDILYCAVGSGHQKGTIERAFRSLNEVFIHRLKGTTFSNTLERAQYDSEGKACISMQGFIYMVHIAFVDVIAASFHSRIGSSPHQAWENGVNENPEVLNCLFKDKLELKLLLMGGLKFRKVSNKGVVIEGSNYYSSELMNLKNTMETHEGEVEEVRVRFDLSDMRSVYVYDKYIKRWLEAFPTGFERLGVVNTEPVHYSELRLHLKLLGEAEKKTDERIIAKALRNIELLEKENQKRLKQEREERLRMLDSGNEQGRIGYQGISSQSISNELLELPEGMETLSLQEETVNKEKDKNKEITKTEIQSSVSYEIQLEELDYFETE